ncbi:MAG: class I tRNA ligase family protein [Candidatus Nomurabacteria bacterium]|nr:class I tRNA ligase family protein [Candidatus Nomurabacteria bacterium]
MEEKDQKTNSALREEAVLKFWNENKIFKKSLEKKSPLGDYVFYEGPPTANGKPGIHHLEARAFKDAIPRYKTMRGYHVGRKGGWDTHGLPVELQVEKKLGLSSKKAIEEYGVAQFNKECKESVWEYVDLWEKFTERIGFWVDQENPYVTYHNDYIESVWNVIKESKKQDLLYKDYKIVPWCPRCGTGLSSHELAQGYQDVKDLSVYAKFKIKQLQNIPISSRFTPEGPYTTQKSEDLSSVYILAWTTTPWTLPGNVALAVGENIDYVKIKIAKNSSSDSEFYILAKARLSIITEEYEIVEEMKGKDLVGLEYEPLYPYLENIISEVEKPKLEKAYKIYNADFVTTEDGTGVVHTAVMYGQDDFVLGNKLGLPKHHIVGLDGKFLEGTGFLEGRFVRDEEVAVDIIKDLAHRGFLFKKEKYEHSYPHCWRCKTALIYYARDSWYIRMSSLKDKLIEENKNINWEPAHVKDGRFGEWIKDIKDWAISRERYWGTPMPVWSCDLCKEIEVLGSIEDIKSKTKKSGNKYIVMRHGETECNLRGEVSSTVNNDDNLTKLGIEQVIKSANELKNQKIDLIISSPFVRTRETAELLADKIGFNKESIIFDERLHEMSLPMYEGKKWDEYHNDYPKTVENFSKAPEGNESYEDVRRRSMSFLYEIEKTYSGKNILIITHGSPVWQMFSEVSGLSTEESLGIIVNNKLFNYIKNGEFVELPFVPLPHDEDFKIDLHKPYIDEINLVCGCGGVLSRTKEVMDVWLDSGAMPFAQSHYPFENKEIQYPADFISEAVDQTRGWFYTLHAVGVIMGRGNAYKNVICLGLLLDAKGKKMSKSIGNIVDPWLMMDKYGVDTLRLWMYSVNQPGESKNFDEKIIAELHNKVFNLLYNVIAFYELYRDKEVESTNEKVESTNILDKWILARLDELVVLCTEKLDDYKLLEPVRGIREFIDDLSTWYLRRSRDRIKEGDIEAKTTIYYVFKTLAKLMAPFAPFSSEDIWQKLKNDKDEESVHLAGWPSIQLGINNEELIIEGMQKAREIVTLGLQARQKAGIPVRQPLGELRITNYELRKEYNEIIKDELNVKEITLEKGEEQNVSIDTHITEDLKKEGQYRELLRAIQDIRKKNGLNPSDVIVLNIETNNDGQSLINKFKSELIKSVSAKEIQIKENDGVEIKIDEFVFRVVIEK